MTRPRIRRREPAVGIALGREELVALVPGDREPRRWPLRPSAGAEPISPDLLAALGALRDGIGGRNAQRALAVALLPSLAELRIVELPGIDATEAARVLTRATARYFAVPDGTAFDVAVEGNGTLQRSPFVAVAAPRGLLDAIAAAAAASGWRVASVASAYGAWAAAAGVAGKSDSRKILLRGTDRVELVEVRAGRVASVRRFPVEAEESIARAADGAMTVTEAAEVIAARHASAACGPVLRTDSERAAFDRRARRASAIRFAAALAIVAIAGAGDLMGSIRERHAIEREREALRAPVARALAARDSLAGAAERIALLRSTTEGAPLWSRVVVSLAAKLPADAFLTSFHASADTVRLEGSAPRAAAVFQALRDDPAVRSLRPQGPIRQSVSPDGATSEGFTLVAVTGRAP